MLKNIYINRHGFRMNYTEGKRKGAKSPNPERPRPPNLMHMYQTLVTDLISSFIPHNEEQTSLTESHAILDKCLNPVVYLLPRHDKNKNKKKKKMLMTPKINTWV